MAGFAGPNIVTDKLQFLVDAMNAQYTRETGDDWKVMMSTFDQVTKSDGSAAGRSIHTINTDAEGSMQHIIQLKVDDPQKYVPAFKKMWSTVKPSGRLTLGQFVSGRKDGVSHYILVSRKDLKDLLSPREWNTKEQAAWDKYREERGDAEIITTMTRALVKQWK